MRTPLPEEFKLSMERELGAEAEELFAALDTDPLTSIRLNPLKPAEVFDGEAVGWSPCGRYLSSRPQFTLDPLLHGGAYYVQEASSQFVGYLLRGLDLEGCRVLDMCAAPGGKSFTMAEIMENQGMMYVPNGIDDVI